MNKKISKILYFCLTTIILTSVFLLLKIKNTNAETIPFKDDFNFDWTYNKIFGPSDILLPSSLIGVSDSYVKGIYSPHVVKFNGKYLMFFGVAPYCNPNNKLSKKDYIPKDSIALAKSDDGINWIFDKYILEPEKNVCFSSQDTWTDGMLWLVNDPSVQVSPDGNYLYMFYTSVFWNYPISGRTCGNIGLAILDKNLNIISNNPTYFSPNATTCPENESGYSRPDIQWTGTNTNYFWFDSNGWIKNVPFSSMGEQLDPAKIKTETTLAGDGGLDVNVPNLDNEKTFILFYKSSGPILGRSKIPETGSWSAPWALTQISGQGWDSSYQGHPQMFLDKDSCDVKLYLSGWVLAPDFSSTYEWNSSIGVALPPADKNFDFPVCLDTTPPAAPTNVRVQ